MFRKEIKFIYDFNLSQVRKLGSYLTYEQIKRTDIHPAILHYISAEIDYLIFEDRQKILKDSIFDYSGELISGHFNQIAEEIKKNKRFSIEFIAQLILHSSSFTVNYLARPRWALMKLIFEDDEHKSTTEIKQILNYVYYYDYLKKIVISYINRKKILSLDYDEFRDLLNKIDDLGFKSDYRVILNRALVSMANFFNIGETHKNMIPLQSVELFLREKGLNAHLMKLRENFPQDEKLVFDIGDYQKVFNTIRYEDSEEVEDVDKDLVEDENTALTEEEEYIEREEEIESADLIQTNSSEIKFKNLFGAVPIEEAIEEKSESIIEDISSETESIHEYEKKEDIKEEVVESWSEEEANRQSGNQFEDELVAIPDGQIDKDEQIEEENGETAKQILNEKTDENDKVETAVNETVHSKPEEIQTIEKEKLESIEPVSDDTEEEYSEKSEKVIELSKSQSDISEFLIDDESEEEMILELVKDDGEPEEELEEESESVDEPKEELEEETEPVDQPKEEIEEEIPPVDELKDDLDSVVDDSVNEDEKQVDTADIYEKTEEIIVTEDKPTVEEINDDDSGTHETEDETKKIITEEPTLFEPVEISRKDEISLDTPLSQEDGDADASQNSESTTQKEISEEELGDHFSESEFVGDEKPKSEIEGKDESDEESIDKETDAPLEDKTSSIFKSEDLKKSKPEKQKTKFEVSELLERKNMTKVIDVIFDYDIEEFANVIDKACHCENVNEAIRVLDNLYKKNQIPPSSKEAKTLKSVISDFFDRKEN
ncbi:hypothetical protein ACFLTH_07590 [Bacteroidota bacterium]